MNGNEKKKRKEEEDKVAGIVQKKDVFRACSFHLISYSEQKLLRGKNYDIFYKALCLLILLHRYVNQSNAD